ncbi:MAG: hypothetical protein A2Y77_02455 [Planctomycetes bacterium RBG_13_62_9]|nr:MAG: hypothetical protein A2Y77_02455 [Planctomycetes bacterium RBG_13_62_9]
MVLAITAAAAAQTTIPLPTMPVRKGLVQNAWIEPAQPTTATSITFYMSVADNVRLDKVEQQRMGSMFTVKVYWTDPPAGATAGSGSAQQVDCVLGALPTGFYTVFAQSLYNGRLADMKSLMFRVTQAPITSASFISNVRVEPAKPIAGEPTSLIVSGEWPTPGYSLVGLTTMLIQKKINVRMDWRSPAGNVLQVVTPYERQIGLYRLSAGTYTVTVTCYRDNLLVDTAQLTFEVEAPADSEFE